jgi:hypothetical protein
VMRFGTGFDDVKRTLTDWHSHSRYMGAIRSRLPS